MVNDAKMRLHQGKEIAEQINILGDDGVPVEYHTIYWKSELIDFVILQQDAFDEIDRNCPLERQEYMLNLVMDICRRDFAFEDFNEVMHFFRELINALKQMNFTEFKGAEFNSYLERVKAMVEENTTEK